MQNNRHCVKRAAAVITGNVYLRRLQTFTVFILTNKLYPHSLTHSQPQLTVMPAYLLISVYRARIFFFTSLLTTTFLLAQLILRNSFFFFTSMPKTMNGGYSSIAVEIRYRLFMFHSFLILIMFSIFFVRRFRMLYNDGFEKRIRSSSDKSQLL